MIDENLLQQRLTAAAAAQDDLLPRALEDDVAAGHRRLRRRRVLAGSVLGATAAVAVLAVGVTSWLTPNASPQPDTGPVAGQSSTPSIPPTSIGPGPGTTGDKPVPATPVQGSGADAVFVRNLNAAIYAHLDPQKVHLDFSSGGFKVDRQLGTILSGGNRIGWRMPGQMGAEGYVALSIEPKNRTPRACGTTSEPRMTCHAVNLPNGRTAQLGRKGDAADVLYQQPDGEWVSVSVSTLFGNNTEIPVHDLGITDQMLLALVQDDRLNLPKLTGNEQNHENALKGFYPSAKEFRAAVARAVPGGTLTGGQLEKVTEQVDYSLSWQRGTVSATIEVGVDASTGVSPCDQQLSIMVACSPITLPNGKKVMFGERAMTYQGGPMYVIGGTYLQPDGDSAHVRILYPGNKVPAGALTKDQILTLLTDPELDK
ncbi:hypothetical protein [Kribbella monticola]|uniref:hypothetical protein n=1 Tax=Kribbella monticola TaxID=2185285 RepID=UPI000DD2C22A|nr:hypothetical protein [Kribbella monticola]